MNNQVQAPNPNVAIAKFNAATRLRKITLPTLTKGAGANTQTAYLPKVGLASILLLAIRGAVTVSAATPNALGFSSIIRRVRLTLNSGIDIFNVSGAGYAYLLQEQLETGFFLANVSNQGRTAVSVASFNLDMVIPISLNLRDTTGLILLQNEQTLATLSVEFESDVTVGGATAVVNATVEPVLWFESIPADPSALPPLNLIHQILEDTSPVSAAGDFVYPIPQGQTILSVSHGFGFGAAGADNFSRLRQRVNQSDFLEDLSVNSLSVEHNYLRGRNRAAGTGIIDWLASSSLGSLGLARDVVPTADMSNFDDVITTTGAGTLYTIRRQILTLRR